MQLPATRTLPPAPNPGGLAVAEAPPRTRRKHSVAPAARGRRCSLAIRHVSGHRLVALLEIVSPANKDRARHIEEFASKVLSALNVGVHVLLVDLFPPGTNGPRRPAWRPGPGRWKIRTSVTTFRRRSR